MAEDRTVSDRVRILKDQEDDAALALSAVEKLRDEELAVVRAKWGAEVAAAQLKRGLARRAVLQAEEQEASHPWVGQKVRLIETKYGGRGWSRTEKSVERFGIVEIVGPSNPWAGSTYRNPGAGAPAVRLLRKNGTPGLKHVEIRNWTLAEPALSPTPRS